MKAKKCMYGILWYYINNVQLYSKLIKKKKYLILNLFKI